jgi:hypothetical protein
MNSTQREELISRYEAGPARLRAALATVPPTALQWRPGPGKWSAHEIAWHCADSETNAASRIRYVVAEKDTLIVGYDQDEWTRLFDYHSLPLEPALNLVDSVRAATTLVIRNFDDDLWQRAGRHSEHPTYGAEEWLKIYAGHVEKHSRQIERNVAEWSRTAG